jgi:gamma-glutamylcyclotransferase (GGCT)/AIG2-like uncharacterized protein YtfP
MHVFTYGSLMFPEVWRRVTGRHHESVKALLIGWSARALIGQVYPGLVPDDVAVTSGVLYLDVDPISLARLDDFEGDFYDRITVKVTTEGGEMQAAEVYRVAPGGLSQVLAESWDPTPFARSHVQTFGGPT